MSDAKTMTNSERAKKASQERWHPSIPKATHTGLLIIAGQEIACDVLEDGKRVLRHKDFARAMGKGRAGSEEVERARMLKIPYFVIANNLTTYLTHDLVERGHEIFYKTTDGRKVIGYDASLLPEVCKIYVQAENDGVFQKNSQQMAIAKVCKTMLYGLATVGITALIDDCTGYVKVRERTELQKILDKYISKELLEWTKKFPDEFFKQVYRIHGWDYPKIGNHPQYLGKFINKYVYEKLPEGVLEELKKRNPTNINGSRKYRHHQFLTQDIGDDNLKKQIVQTITVMKLSKNIDDFKELNEKLY